jgi:hypothetical protein
MEGGELLEEIRYINFFLKDEVNKILSHPTMPVTITASENKKIRFYDNNTGLFK